jgi:hypothetical protein
VALKFPTPADPERQVYFRFNPEDIICRLDEPDINNLREMAGTDAPLSCLTGDVLNPGDVCTVVTQRYLKTPHVQAQLELLASKLLRTVPH